jgi:hypothetical protein
LQQQEERAPASKIGVGISAKEINLKQDYRSVESIIFVN